MSTINVDLGPRSYPIWCDSAGYVRLTARLKSTRPILLTTPTVRRWCAPRFFKKLNIKSGWRILEIPDGERFKNLATVTQLYRQLIRLKADRTTPLLILGGGVVGDLGGFVASTYLRGVPYYQIPTTLLAQVDSSVGGKVGVDLPEGKNLVGAFYQPKAVLTDVTFLQSLPERELTDGLAEVVKYALIGDPALLRLLLRTRAALFSRKSDRLQEVVVRSIRIKAKTVSMDEREQGGIRRLLNLGHTVGHALEKLTRYRRYRHGEAVAIGLDAAARISYRLGLCSQAVASEVHKSLEALGLPTKLPRFVSAAWLRAIGVDKKIEQGMIQFVFLKKIGQVVARPISPRHLVELL